MRAAVVVILAIAAALIAPRLAIAPAQSHVPGAALPDCRAVLAVPGELHALVAVGAGAACGPAVVLMPSPLTLADMSAQGMAHIWARPEPAPNARIARAQRAIRKAYDHMMDGIEAFAAPAQDPQAVPTSQAVLP
jgi:hypothetical protein